MIYSTVNILLTECFQMVRVCRWLCVFDTSTHCLHACVCRLSMCHWVYVEVWTPSEELAELITGEGCVWAATCPPSFHLPCLSPNLMAVSCHSLMDAPGPTIAHYSLLLLSLHSQSRQGQICLSVVHLSHSACWHLCYREQEGMCVRVSKKRKREKERKRQNDREEKEGK